MSTLFQVFNFKINEKKQGRSTSGRNACYFNHEKKKGLEALEKMHRGLATAFPADNKDNYQKYCRANGAPNHFCRSDI